MICVLVRQNKICFLKTMHMCACTFNTYTITINAPISTAHVYVFSTIFVSNIPSLAWQRLQGHAVYNP